MKNNIAVIIPAYNEKKHIIKVIKKTKRYAKNIVVVDDGSKDNTADLAQKEKVTVLKHITNLGKGNALKTGCEYAVKNGSKVLVVMDSDGQHDPAMIPKFTSLIKRKRLDIVFGVRKLSGQMPLLFRLGNGLINKITEVLYGIKLMDTQCGFRAFTAKAYRKIRWESADYSAESEMIARAGKNKLKYDEIIIPTIYKDKFKGTTPIDGIKIVLNIIWWRLTI